MYLCISVSLCIYASYKYNIMQQSPCRFVRLPPQMYACHVSMYLCIYVSMYKVPVYHPSISRQRFSCESNFHFIPLSPRWIPSAFDSAFNFWHLVSRYPECVIDGASPAQQICCVGNTTSVCLTCGKGQRPGESFKAIFEQRAVQFWPPQVTIVGSLGNPGSLCKKFNLCRNWNPNLWSQAVSSRDIALTLSLSAPTQCLTSALLSRPPTLDHQVNTSSVACRALKKLFS